MLVTLMTIIALAAATDLLSRWADASCIDGEYRRSRPPVQNESAVTRSAIAASVLEGGSK